MPGLAKLSAAYCAHRSRLVGIRKQITKYIYASVLIQIMMILVQYNGKKIQVDLMKVIV